MPGRCTVSDPTAEHPHRVELCWTPEQNLSQVATYPRRYPVTAIVGQLRAGEDAERVAVEYELTVKQVQLLWRLAGDLVIEDTLAPTRDEVLAALDHENFCRWSGHRHCCGVTVEDCTCNVADNVRAMERFGWLQVTDD